MSGSCSSNTQPLVLMFARLMKDQQLTLATAESCTGGMLAQRFTAIRGSSKWFECGFVTYSDVSKTRLLGVQAKVLDEHGAVSKKTAEQMALGALRNSAADISVSITGIAGPEGGCVNKPVGTVYIAIARLKQDPEVTHYLFKGDRDSIRKQATLAAISQLVEQIS